MPAAMVGEGGTQAAVQDRIVWPQAQGFLVMGNGLREISEFDEGDGQVLMGGGIVGEIA